MSEVSKLFGNVIGCANSDYRDEYNHILLFEVKTIGVVGVLNY